MSEIVTYQSEREALKWRPYRKDFEYKLYLNKVTDLYQWMNDPRLAKRYGLFRIFPDPEPIIAGFGESSFGLAPFGR